MKQIILIFLIYYIPFNLGFSQQEKRDKSMNSALILIDIQNDYFDNGSMTLVGSEKASENARLLLQEFRANKLPIIHIQHIATKASATFFLPNTIGAEIHNNVKPLSSEKVIIKHYPNSFKETELLNYLKNINVTNLVICGMMTHMCIDATARAAKDFEFNVLVIGDACATKDLEILGKTVKAEEVQKSFLAALNSYYATVVTTEQYFMNE